MITDLSRGFLFACGVLLATAARGDTVMVGDPQHPADLAAALTQAHTQGAKDITIVPGVYEIPSPHHDTITLDHWSDTTIHSACVTLIFEDVEHTPVVLQHCARVTWDGGIFRFVHPAFTQGRIAAIGTDDKGAWCDWRVDTGYSSDYEKSWFNIVDQKTRVLKVNAGDWSPASTDQTSPGLFRFHYPADRAGHFDIGDWLIARAHGGWSIVYLSDCEACTLHDVTLQNGGFAAFHETGGVGGNRYLSCKIETGPRPPGATEDPLVSSGADGFHSNETETGPDIEDCVFSGVFTDDCIAIHGMFDRVTQAEGRKVTLTLDGRAFQPGDSVRIADMNGFFAEAKCAAVEPGPDRTEILTLDRDLTIPIDHTQDGDKKKGTKAYNPRYCGSGYKILRCHLGNTRSRGILVKADNGLIDGNTIEGCGMSGVSIGPEFWWNEAGYCWNVTVSNNTFLNCDLNNSDQATVWIHGDGAIGNRNITIQANTFASCYGEYIIRVDDTNGVQITGNHISHSFELKPWNPGHAIWLEQSKNVKLLDNIVTDQGSFAGPLVGLHASVTPDDVQHDDEAGIKLSP